MSPSCGPPCPHCPRSADLGMAKACPCPAFFSNLFWDSYQQRSPSHFQEQAAMCAMSSLEPR